MWLLVERKVNQPVLLNMIKPTWVPKVVWMKGWGGWGGWGGPRPDPMGTSQVYTGSQPLAHGLIHMGL